MPAGGFLLQHCGLLLPVLANCWGLPWVLPARELPERSLRKGAKRPARPSNTSWRIEIRSPGIAS